MEQRLRSALAELADDLPPSQDAWAEQQRRQGSRRTRRPMLVAAATAAAAAAVIVVPVLTSGREQDRSPAVSSGSPVVSSTAPTAVDPSLSAGPFALGEFTDSGRVWQAWTFVERPGALPQARWCVVAVPVGEPATSANRHPQSTGCQQVGLPQPPPVHDVEILTRSVLSRLPGDPPPILVFETDPRVSVLQVREAYGEPVPVTELAAVAGHKYFAATFPESSSGFGYTALDANGVVLTTAIT